MERNGPPLLPRELTRTWSEDEDDLEEAEVVDDELLFADEQEPEVSGSAAGSAPLSSRPPLSTVTLAEIYLAQGFHDQALRIYEDLFLDDPDNGDLLRRITEIEALRSEPFFPLAAPESAVSENRESPAPPLLPAEIARKSHGERVVAELEQWLESIRRRTACH